MRSPLGLLVAFLLMVAPSHAATTFTGDFDHAWDNAANWTDGVPTAEHDVVIPFGESVSVGKPEAANSLVLEPGAYLQLNHNLTIDGGAASSFAADLHVNGATLSVAGPVTWTSGTWSLYGAIVRNHGTLQVDAADARMIDDSDGNSTFDNLGTVTRDVPGTWTVEPQVHSSGTFDVLAGTVTTGAGMMIDGTGTTTVAAGAALGTAGEHFLLQGGVLTGAGTLAGSVINSGTVSPIGVLTVDGDYEQSGGGELVVAVDHAGHERLEVSGSAKAGGTLTVAAAAGHDPAVGATFDVLEAAGTGGVTRSFSTLSAPPLAGKRYELSYPSGVVRLVVSEEQPPPPPPPTSLTPPALPTAAREGESVTCRPGTWEPVQDAFHFGWYIIQRGHLVPIPAETSAFTVPAGEVGSELMCTAVPAHWEYHWMGFQGGVSNRMAIVGPAPANGAPPVVTPAEAVAGDVLSCAPGRWDGGEVTHVWLRDGTPVDGETAATYTTGDGDAGRAISCRSTATDLAGSVSADSNAVTPSARPDPVQEPPPPAPRPVAREVPIRRLASLPTAKRCVRALRMRLRAGVTGEVQVLAGGRRVRVLRGAALRRPIVLRRLPKGRWTLEIVVTGAAGEQVRAKRRFRTCRQTTG